MKNLYFLKTLLILIATMPVLSITKAQDFNLIDVNKTSNSNPLNNEYSARNAYAYLNGYFYFSTNDGIHGRELWKTNGTAAGTQMVKDINPGFSSSDTTNDNFFTASTASTYDLTVSGGKVYFAATDGVHGVGLWETDGTDVGTYMVPGVVSPSNPMFLTDVNGTLFFFFFNSSQLWKTNGTAGGSVLITTFTNSEFFQQGINVNGKFFFTFLGDGGYQLYRSDGTPSGTIKLPVTSFEGRPLTHFTASNGLLYFAANAGTSDQLWVSDGTVNGTHAVINNNISLFINYDDFLVGLRDPFSVVNNVLYFPGTTAAAGTELYKYDQASKPAGVTLVKDIVPGADGSNPALLTNVNNTLFFTINAADQDAQLWKSNGTSAGTVLVKDINPGGTNIYSDLTNANGTLLFSYSSNVYGNELWKSNGTAAGTNIVKDINPGIYSSAPQDLTYNNGLLLFGANDGVNGVELWKSDKTTSGTSMVKNINITTTSSSSPAGLTATDTDKVFSAANEQYGRELWVTDGTSSGTRLVKDIYPGAADASPSLFTKFRAKTYFFAADSTSIHLWKTNGTPALTVKILTPNLVLNPDAHEVISSMIASNDLIYFVVSGYTGSSDSYRTEARLFRSDGTSAGTYYLTTSFFNPLNIFAVGNTLFFARTNESNVTELWRSNGLVTGTMRLKNLYPASSDLSVGSFINYNGKLYFSASDDFRLGDHGLWTSDGTGAGTTLVKSINASPFAQANGKFFLAGPAAGSNDFDLFTSNGTSAGTQLVKAIGAGTGAEIFNYASGNKVAYFTVLGGGTLELWKSDGTINGTTPLKDLTFLIQGGSLLNFNLVNVNDKLFFIINDSLWTSDGTSAGTHKVNDATLNGLSGLSNLTYLDGYLYFTGTSATTGTELYAAKLSPTLAPVETVNNTIISNPDEFAAKLLTNPVVSQVKLSVTVKTQQTAQVLITDVSGKTIKSGKQVLVPGTNTFSYDAGTWPRGMYMIRIVTAKGSSGALKAIK